MPSDHFLRMAVFYAAHQAARLKGLELPRALEFATDCALAPYQRLHRIARQLARRRDLRG
jgi:hypothetical protein